MVILNGERRRRKMPASLIMQDAEAYFSFASFSRESEASFELGYFAMTAL
jgi:hypothetical protein